MQQDQISRAWLRTISFPIKSKKTEDEMENVQTQDVETEK